MNATNTQHDLKVMIGRIEKLLGFRVTSYKPGSQRFYSLWQDRSDGRESYDRKISDSLPAREFLAFLNGFEVGSWQHEPVDP